MVIPPGLIDAVKEIFQFIVTLVCTCKANKKEKKKRKTRAKKAKKA